VVPLVVDLDGTLVRTDTLYETFLLLLKRNPLYLLLVPFWLLKGKAHLKAEIARRVDLDATRLPYREDLVAWLREEKERGRPLVLATAADGRIAQAVASYLGLFSAVHASDGTLNLGGERKLKRLRETITGPFDYVGDSADDVALWRGAREAVVVEPSRRLRARAESVAKVSRVFEVPSRPLKALIKGIRVHQWAKNVLVFVPVVAGHKMRDLDTLLHAGLGFASFCLCASSVYVLNDLLDLSSDRRHPTKRNRPFASGALRIRTGLLLFPALLAGGVLLALWLPAQFLLLLGAYYATTLAYSFYLKQVMVLDVLLLAGLYTVRLFAGSLATSVPTSSWLFTFSMFLFFSLALVKRLSEVRRLRLSNETEAHGRGYLAGDYEQLGSLGTASAFLSVLVLSLYITSKDITVLYAHPERLWLLCPLMLYWISRVWLLAHRGRVNEDPLVFALKDGVSYAVGCIAAVILYLAV
jgi:4-hydroxybenzoate polyprenyltransferase